MTPSAPRLEARELGRPGGLVRDLLAGGPAASLLPSGSLEPAGEGDLPELGPARLPPSVIRGRETAEGARLEALEEGRGVLVTTGQQPVLFLGPLLVLYKAVTALTLAETLRDRGVPAAALFWVAADDHDWGEVGTTRLIDTDNRLRTLSLEPPPERRSRSVGPSPLPERVVHLFDELSQYLPKSEFVPGYLDLIREAYRPGRTVSEAFGTALEGLLEAVGLPWVDAADPELRRAACPLFRRVLEHQEEARAALRRGTERVREAGYEPQVETGQGALPLFVDRPEGRTRLFASGAGLVRVGTEGEEVPVSEILEELASRPGRFSPDVALRPVLASWLLPTAATVLGPSELAYWAQLGEFFRWAGVPFPRLRPRDSWTVVEDKVDKVLGKLGAEVGAFADGGEVLARGVREAGTPERVAGALEEARSEVAAALAGVEEAVERDLPGIRSAVGAARHEAFEVLDGLERAVVQRVEERHEVLLGQIEKAALHLFPDGRPQERMQSPFYFLARYGEAFLEAVFEASRGARPGGPRD